MSEPRRIIVVGPPFLQSLVREVVAGADDLVVVAELDSEAGLSAAGASSEADFAIVAVREPDLAEEYLDLWEERPRTKVLALAGDEVDAALWELTPHRTLIGQISREALLQAMRDPDWRALGVG